MDFLITKGPVDYTMKLIQIGSNIIKPSQSINLIFSFSTEWKVVTRKLDTIIYLLTLI